MADQGDDLSSRITAAAAELSRASTSEFEFVERYLEGLPKRLGKEKIIPLKDCTIPLLFEGKDKKDNTRVYSAEDLLKADQGAIIGPPGSGKSVSLKLRAIERAKTARRERGTVPLYVKLADYEGGDLEEFLTKQAGIKGFDDIVKGMLEEGKFELLLDGLDELTDKESRKEMIGHLRNHGIIKRNHTIIASRPNTYPGLGVPVFQVQPLERDNIEEFLKINYNKSPFDYRVLFDKIEKEENLFDMCRNPLILSFVMKLFETSQINGDDFNIDNKAHLYKQIIEGEFIEREEGEKGREYISNTLNALKEIGYLMQADPEISGKVVRWDKIKGKVEAALGERYQEFMPKIIEAIEQSSLVLLEDNKVNFAHPSIQEYFCAAQFADRINGGDTVQEMYDEYWSYEEKESIWGVGGRCLLPAWQNTIGFVAGLLDRDKAVELAELLSRDYLENKDKFGEEDYNPFYEDLVTALRVIGIKKLYDCEVKERVYQACFDADFRAKNIEALCQTGEFEHFWTEMLGSESGHIENACKRIGSRKAYTAIEPLSKLLDRGDKVADSAASALVDIEADSALEKASEYYRSQIMNLDLTLKSTEWRARDGGRDVHVFDGISLEEFRRDRRLAIFWARPGEIREIFVDNKQVMKYIGALSAIPGTRNLRFLYDFYFETRDRMEEKGIDVASRILEICAREGPEAVKEATGMEYEELAARLLFGAEGNLDEDRYIEYLSWDILEDGPHQDWKEQERWGVNQHRDWEIRELWRKLEDDALPHITRYLDKNSNLSLGYGHSPAIEILKEFGDLELSESYLLPIMISYYKPHEVMIPVFGDQTGRLLADRLGGMDEEQTRNALLSLKEMKDPCTFEAISDYITQTVMGPTRQSENTKQTLAAMVADEDMDLTFSYGIVCHGLDSPDPDVRRLALVMAGKKMEDHHQKIQMMAKADVSREVRDKAIQILSKDPTPEDLEILHNYVGQVDDGNWKEMPWISALRVLVQKDYEHVKPRLRELIHHDNQWISRFSIEACQYVADDPDIRGELYDILDADFCYEDSCAVLTVLEGNPRDEDVSHMIGVYKRYQDDMPPTDYGHSDKKVREPELATFIMDALEKREDIQEDKYLELLEREKPENCEGLVTAMEECVTQRSLPRLFEFLDYNDNVEDIGNSASSDIMRCIEKTLTRDWLVDDGMNLNRYEKYHAQEMHQIIRPEGFIPPEKRR
ncbi:hypothetical protein GF351_03830 [Candidatus Woesearchaeota archaeon]|nr:hypothetical protein [Candidatus Woesearchaeota archaeon]